MTALVLAGIWAAVAYGFAITPAGRRAGLTLAALAYFLLLAACVALRWCDRQARTAHARRAPAIPDETDRLPALGRALDRSSNR